MIERPQKEHYNPFYETYISKIPEGTDILQYIQDQKAEFMDFVRGNFSNDPDYQYGPDKWTVKQVLGHCIDTETIMLYRALTISREDGPTVPGFDENDYVEAANFQDRSLDELLNQFSIVRDNSLAFLKGFDQKFFSKTGIANGSLTSVAAITYIIAGHLAHHKHILTTRYLS